MPKKAIFNPDTDKFFTDRWRERTLDEGGKIHHHKKSAEATEPEQDANKMENGEAIKIYLEMIDGIGDDEELKPLLADLNRAIIHYASTTAHFHLSRKELVAGNEMSEKDKEESDLAKRLAHNSVISALSSLSRAYVKKKGVNMWRYKIDEGRGDRDRIAEWVKEVAPLVENKMNAE
ncbi:MAG: DUF3232 domain-containing protein [Candidatus Buchananbacteria bacterium]|jgi:hypothetical protein